MNLSPAQSKLVEQLDSDLTNGLTSDQVLERREQAGTYNTVKPPIQCPAWICCLLPCIKHIPSMKLFRQVQPEDAEVLRNGEWIRYDASSLVKGDVIRLEEGDLVPADCIVLQVDSSSDLLVDGRYVTGEAKPRSAASSSGDSATTQPVQLFYGGHVVQGSGVAIVTAIGPETLLSSLIQEGRFPPVETTCTIDTADEETGISLLNREPVV